ncbi:MASE2 domain-containing protein, partial [Salmonella enterica subsp. enterica serovar Enteritidis]
MFQCIVSIITTWVPSKNIVLIIGVWSFVWPHLAWQWAAKALDPLRQEIY